ncbi:hemerythrin domain-containing protein [Streptomyces millisiae]|uniref:Hemerythrin domain-containing protein n=1 Tax=Streptomyces millisiae TaxID=3075542 RepID=A0ABU2LSF6_9ACTN|nr:hemerythrin domain-containing protein [Streptomyces sp. DSM 44918]MDT0320520.1 hemerythrin domain-containing protein [Streptomyces sp. DSM 44918]
MTAPAHPEDDVIRILLDQHARIRELFTEVKSVSGVHRQQAFDELRALLAVHETAEEMILRPVAKETAGPLEADARNREEEAANRVLVMLERLDVDSPDFDRTFLEFEQSVLRHAEHEEREEFPTVRAGRTPAELEDMGLKLRAAEKVAPTHPHPSTAGKPAAQWALGPFASLVDRTRDAIDAAAHRPSRPR